MSSTVLEDVARIIDPEPWAQVDRWYVHGERVNVDQSIVKPSVDKARTILALIPGRDEAALPEAPEGWVLVPREPKPEMVGAFWRVKNGHHFDGEPPPADTSDYAAYRAMITAAPPPPVGGQAGDHLAGVWWIGQPMHVVREDDPGHWSHDYRADEIVYYAGEVHDVDKGEVNVWVASCWPPKHHGDITDGWSHEHLTPAPPAPTDREGGR